MEIVSSTEGSSIITGWKRLSSAASFSILFWYSSSVVAPMQWSFPRASIGLSRLPRVHCTLCFSRSHNSVELVNEQDYPALTLLDLLENGFETLFKLAPVLRPAIRAPISREKIVFSLSPSGTSPKGCAGQALRR